MYRILVAVLILVIGSSISVRLSDPAFAQKRVALVIGNSAYQHTSKLTNPKNDATDIAGILKTLGFQVIDGYDLDKTGFDQVVREFANALDGADVGMFFYAGHGVAVAGQNYLVPVDAQLPSAVALEFELVRAETVLRVMERQTNTNVLFLDACRDNPLSRNLARTMGTRSTEIGKGLASVESGIGTLISFSTQPGNVALDGVGRNSPYSGALARHLSTSSDDLSAILIAVRNDVMEETNRRQVPWEHSALTGRFYFSSSAEPVKVAPPRQSEAAEAWKATKDTNSKVALEAFIKRYGDAYYSELARARIIELQKNQEAAILPKAEGPAEAKFDGSWIVKVVSSSGCSAKPWTYKIAIRSAEIFRSGEQVGRVEQDGRFSYVRPNPNFPNLKTTINGKLGQTSGSASFVTGNCTGIQSVTKE